MTEEVLVDIMPSVIWLGEQAAAIMRQLHVLTDIIQMTGGAIFGALAAYAVIQGLKL